MLYKLKSKRRFFLLSLVEAIEKFNVVILTIDYILKKKQMYRRMESKSSPGYLF